MPHNGAKRLPTLLPIADWLWLPQEEDLTTALSLRSLSLSLSLWVTPWQRWWLAVSINSLFMAQSMRASACQTHQNHQQLIVRPRRRRPPRPEVCLFYSFDRRAKISQILPLHGKSGRGPDEVLTGSWRRQLRLMFDSSRWQIWMCFMWHLIMVSRRQWYPVMTVPKGGGRRKAAAYSLVFTLLYLHSRKGKGVAAHNSLICPVGAVDTWL